MSARTVPLSLQQLVERAQVIVRGHVVSARVEPHPQFQNLSTVVVVISVDETLKGSPGKSLEFRQYLWGGHGDKATLGYTKGQELLLMLNPVSQYGLTSPVGLEQGRFRIMRDSSGAASAINGRGNLGLFLSTREQARAKGITLSQAAQAMLRRKTNGPVPVRDLEETVRGFAKVSKQ